MIVARQFEIDRLGPRPTQSNFLFRFKQNLSLKIKSNLNIPNYLIKSISNKKKF